MTIRPPEPPLRDTDIGEEELDPMMPPPSSSSGRSRFSFGNIKMGDTGKILLISALVTVLVLGVMSYAGKGGFFVNKTDFTKNMGDIVSALDSTSAIAQAAKSNVDTAIQSIPGQVSSQVTQKTSDWESRLSQISSRLSTLESSTQSNTNKINEVSSQLNTEISKLKAEFQATQNELESSNEEFTTEINGKLSEMSANITALLARIQTLENQAVVSAVTVSDVLHTLSITSGYIIKSSDNASDIPILNVTNNSATNKNIQVRLVLINKSGGSINVTNATMKIGDTVLSTPITGTTSIANGGPIIFQLTVPVGAGGIGIWPGITTILTYDNNLASYIWDAQWSIQP
jgi:Skp family chaperone for outer membrane proteins